MSDFNLVSANLTMSDLRCLARYLRKNPDEARKQPELDWSKIDLDLKPSWLTESTEVDRK